MKKKYAERLIIILLAAAAAVSGAVLQNNRDPFSGKAFEVVQNEENPRGSNGTPWKLAAQPDWTLRVEDEAIARLGLAEIAVFDVDEEGNLYVWDRTRICKFDARGRFVGTFEDAIVSDTPGQTNKTLFAGNPGRIVAVEIDDKAQFHFYEFAPGGKFLGMKDIHFDPEPGSITRILHIEDGIPLRNGNFLFVRGKVDVSRKMLESILYLYDAKLEKIRELERRALPNPIAWEKIDATYHNLAFGVSKTRIYTGSQEKGYEISVYDFDGRLLRKIRKKAAPVPPHEAYRNEIFETMKSPVFAKLREKFYFPDALPPFHSFTVSEDDTLLVMTYEPGRKLNEFMYDVFDKDGILTARESLKSFAAPDRMKGAMKKGRLYLIPVKETGYKTLEVYRFQDR